MNFSDDNYCLVCQGTGCTQIRVGCNMNPNCQRICTLNYIPEDLSTWIIKCPYCHFTCKTCHGNGNIDWVDNLVKTEGEI